MGKFKTNLFQRIGRFEWFLAERAVIGILQILIRRRNTIGIDTRSIIIQFIDIDEFIQQSTREQTLNREKSCENEPRSIDHSRVALHVDRVEDIWDFARAFRCFRNATRRKERFDNGTVVVDRSTYAENRFSFTETLLTDITPNKRDQRSVCSVMHVRVLLRTKNPVWSPDDETCAMSEWNGRRHVHVPVASSCKHRNPVTPKERYPK